MRLDQKQELTAEYIVNYWSEEELVKIFREYGEEPLARPIAQAIIAVRRDAALRSPAMLVQTIAEVYHRRYHRPSKINPATRVFMALRIAVNDELNVLSRVLPQAVSALKPNGRLAVVTFHSLEDRIVKNYFRQESKQCLCPPEVPVCCCQHQAILKIITKKPLSASLAEITQNPRARSAKLRVAQKI
jgi:16S rRNA (cytosine1402-N4)-methyltransferase